MRILFLLAMGLATEMSAQNTLYVEHKGQMYPVRKAVENQPYVRYEGKLVQASGDRFALRQADEYLPVTIEVRDVRVSSSRYESIEGAPP